MSRLNIILVVAVLVGAVILSSFGSSAMQKLQAGFLRAVSPFLKTGSAVQRQLGAMGEGLKTLDQLEDENQRLTTENTELRHKETREVVLGWAIAVRALNPMAERGAKCIFMALLCDLCVLCG